MSSFICIYISTRHVKLLVFKEDSQLILSKHKRVDGSDIAKYLPHVDSQQQWSIIQNPTDMYVSNFVVSCSAAVVSLRLSHG